MNDSARNSEPPDEPYLTSEAVLSPTSPKPLQFPQPTNIPILDKMMDVGFNQTEAHMTDPTMHDTTLRADAWRPDEQQTEATDHASPFSTGGDAADLPKQVSSTQPEESADAEVLPSSNETATANGDDAAQVSSLLNGMTYDTNPFAQTDSAPDANATQAEALPAPAPDSTATEPAEPAETAPTAAVVPSQPDEVAVEAQPAPFPGAVDVQALLDTLSQNPPATTGEAAVSLNVEGNAATDQLSSFQSQAQPPIPGAEASSPLSAPALGAPPSGLPARPPPQEQPLMNSNYAHSHHIRDYHPHAATPAVQPHAHSNGGDLAGAFPAQTAPPTPVFHLPLGNTQAFQQNGQFAANANVVPPLPNFPATQQSTAAAPPAESSREFGLNGGETLRAEDTPWTPDIQGKYDRFIKQERLYVNEARWDQFPNGSRLFVGNLSSEKVTKRDIFHVFHAYGELAQISIKQAYGFVQFLRTEDCQRALSAEQGRQIRDKRIHLEISKPQKGSNRQQNAGRRSRSPDNRRNDRQRIASNGRERGGNGYRAGYRNDYRSPSPPPRGYRERYDDRYRGRRSRSRSPQYGRDSYGGPSPRRGSEDDLPLPRRPPHEVPEVQLIAFDQLDRDFVAWVNKAFTSRGVRVDTLILSPRLDEDAVVRRQIVEGVLAVSKLRRQHQDAAKMDLTIFKRKGGSADVNFEGYTNLDPNICAELVLRERQLQQAVTTYGNYAGAPPPYATPHPPLPQYGYPPQTAPPVVLPTGYPPGYGQQTPAPYGRPPTGAPPSAPPSHADPNNLQNLLSTLNQPSATTPHSATASQYGAPPPGYPPMPPQQYGGQQPGYPPQHNQPPQQAQQPNMQDILARLGNYNR